MIGWRKKAEHPGAISLAEHPDISDDYLEIARLWVSPEQGRSYVLTGFMDQWPPELFGSLLVESVHTAAAGYATHSDMTKDEVLQRIWSGFDGERAGLGSESSEETQ